MDENKEVVAKRGVGSWLWIIVTIVVLVGGLAAWYFISNKSDSGSKTSESAESAVTATAPKNADWQLYTSKKYGFKLYYPKEYTVAEGATGTIKLNKGTTEMMDLYVTSAAGDSGGMMKSQVALFTDDTKGYMTGGVESSTVAAGVSAKMLTGTFGKNAGIAQTHSGIIGRAVVFIKNDNQYVIDSYDNGDTAAKSIFDDMMADMSF